jgi:hypothetical protein
MELIMKKKGTDGPLEMTGEERGGPWKKRERARERSELTFQGSSIV